MIDFYRILNSIQVWIVISSFVNYVFDTNAVNVSDNYGSYYILFGLPFYYFVRRSFEKQRDSTLICSKINSTSRP
jgi:uncharacterized membrane protein